MADTANTIKRINLFDIPATELAAPVFWPVHVVGTCNRKTLAGWKEVPIPTTYPYRFDRENPPHLMEMTSAISRSINCVRDMTGYYGNKKRDRFRDFWGYDESRRTGYIRIQFQNATGANAKPKRVMLRNDRFVMFDLWVPVLKIGDNKMRQVAWRHGVEVDNDIQKKRPSIVRSIAIAVTRLIAAYGSDQHASTVIGEWPFDCDRSGTTITGDRIEVPDCWQRLGSNS